MGSGGGSAGAVSYPPYIQNFHDQVLNFGAVTLFDTNITASFNIAITANPFTGLVAYDPDVDIASAQTQLSNLLTVINTLSAVTDFNTFYDAITAKILEEAATLDQIALDDSEIAADVVSYDAVLIDQLEDVALPQFKSGMLNIGAVNSSAFIIGEALLRAYKARDIARYTSELRIGLNTQRMQINGQMQIKYREIQANHKIRRGELIRQNLVQVMAAQIKEIELIKDHATLFNDITRMKLIAKKEESAEQADFNEKEALWEMELYQYIGNLLAAPGGGTAPAQKRPSKTVSALSGALGGAATGAALSGGNPYGIAAGALVGAGLALSQ